MATNGGKAEMELGSDFGGVGILHEQAENGLFGRPDTEQGAEGLQRISIGSVRFRNIKYEACFRCVEASGGHFVEWNESCRAHRFKQSRIEAYENRKSLSGAGERGIEVGSAR